MSLIKDIASALEPKVVDCPYKKKRVIFVVTKIMIYEDGSIGLAWSCSNGEDCDIDYCRYSRAWKQKRKHGV